VGASPEKTTLVGLMASFGAHRAGGDGLDDLSPRFNGSPGQDYPIIVREPDVAGAVFMLARWGLIPRWMKDPNGGPRPINARSEVVATNGMFQYAHRYGRALMPIDNYFERKAIKGEKTKQPYAIALKTRRPFALAAIWDSWRDAQGVEHRTFAVLTCPPNEMIATIHDRMPVILHPEDYPRWLSDLEPDPHDLLKPFPSYLMTMWPISTKVNYPRNDAPDILDRVDVFPTDLFSME
jgi:putative SOS response-associated peptidase YedK